MKKKREVRDRILHEVGNIARVRNKCRGKRLSIVIRFYLYDGSNEEGRVKKDLDNLAKIVLDTLPDYMDRGHAEPGLKLIEGDSDHWIFDLSATKELVKDPLGEGVDLEIFEWMD